MNRTLTAAVALAAGLGVAGLAHAQSSANPSAAPDAVSPSGPSSRMVAPGGTQNPSVSSPSSAQGPQANSQATHGMPQDVSPSQIQQAQQQLKQQGLYGGAVDGIVGPETENALAQFQKQQGLPQTAQLDQQTLKLLANGPGAEPSAGKAGTAAPRTPTSRYPAGTENPTTSGTGR